MSAVTAPVPFEKLAKKYKPKSASVQAYQHKGEPRTFTGLNGTQVAKDGDFVVLVGQVTRVEHVAPRDGKPGMQRTVLEPAYETMAAEGFEALYEQ